MEFLHLIEEAKLSQVALKNHTGPVPHLLWAVAGPLPDDIELGPPNPIWKTEPGTEKQVRHDEHLMHALSYEEFLQIKEMCSTVFLFDDKTGLESFAGMISVKRFAESIGYSVRLYETCDY